RHATTLSREGHERRRWVRAFAVGGDRDPELPVRVPAERVQLTAGGDDEAVTGAGSHLDWARLQRRDQRCGAGRGLLHETGKLDERWHGIGPDPSEAGCVAQLAVEVVAEGVHLARRGER